MTRRSLTILGVLALTAGMTYLFAQPPAGRGGRGRPGGGSFPGLTEENFFVSKTQPKDDAEKKIIEVLEGMQAQGRGMMSVPMDDGRFLRMLAEFADAKHVVEIGTSQGMSAIWFCMALRKTNGKLTTFEIDEGRAKAARENFKRAGVEEIVTLVFGDAHKEVAKIEGKIDILFLDADKEGYIDYLNKLLPQVRDGGLVIAHNMNTRQADPKFLKAITENPKLDTLLVRLQASGLSVSVKKR